MDFSGMDFDLDFDLDFDIEMDKADDEEKAAKEFIRTAKLPYKPVCYKNAQDMAAGIDIREDYFCMVSGSFIFGDFLEALIDRYKIVVQSIYISTLGMSENNVDSIVNLCRFLHVKQLNLIISGYFFGVERHNLIPYMVREFKRLPINVAVVASHAKITLIDFGALRIVIHGSANLSSSRNLETFFITHDNDVYDFVRNIFDGIMERFTIIDGKEDITTFGNHKNNTSQKLWRQVVTMNGEENNNG